MLVFKIKFFPILFWHVTDERLFQTISYKLPAESYAIFRLKTSNRPLGYSNEEIIENDDVRQRRHLELSNSSINPHRARKESALRNSSCANPKVEKAFPKCAQKLQNCDSEEFGQCLVQIYPQMNDLSSNSEDLFGTDFDSDETCTAFVREFFAQCRNFIPSCQEVKGNQRMALTVLGCLFSQYPDLMLPLLDLHS